MKRGCSKTTLVSKKTKGITAAMRIDIKRPRADRKENIGDERLKRERKIRWGGAFIL